MTQVAASLKAEKVDQRTIRRLLYISGIALITLASLLLVAGSPFALSPLSRFRSNWALLSNIGQTYGAISALLAAIGISGIAATIMLQIRESRRSRVDAIRSHHYDLYRMAIDDSSLTEISHGVSQIQSLKERKQAIYINLQLQFWLMLGELDSLPEDTLRGYAADLFETEPGRNYWKRSGTGRMSRDTDARKEVRFLQVVNQEYLRLAQKTKNNLPDAAQETSSRFKVTTTVSVIIAFVAGAAIAKSIRMRTIGANSAETRR